ncbi:FtsX-like permease family protein [Rhodococcus oryzae]|uniref:FtsX-like permease family protein n=1 Tax=Rhodococcus oryzae TaxID=2571143 RepID=A0ABY2RR98_9NOCA|nr:ABC transporter permease [Rhodococcus oryzae]TJZ81502.1 FtsX-like permease family protein [Rhodococcus oryzae]
MLRLTLAQARAHFGRYLAAMLAVLIAVAFVVATLVLSSTATAGVTNSLAGQYRSTDYVVSDLGDGLQAQRAADAVRSVPGVRAVTTDVSTPVKVTAAGSGKSFGAATSLAADADLRWQKLADGRFPSAAGEIAVGSNSDLPIGTRVAVTALGETTGPDAGEATVVGTVDLDGTAQRMDGISVFATAADIEAWTDGQASREMRVAGGDREAVAGALAPGAAVITGAEKAKEVSARFLGGSDMLRNVLLAFGALAVVVSGLVIANTFAVLLAARTQELALLRCVGATSDQIRRSVRIESLVVGLVASVAGLAAGVGLAWAVTEVAGALDVPIPLDHLSVSPVALAVGLLVGVVVTYLAAVAPARAATAVSPLAALTPAEAKPEPVRSSRLRRIIGVTGLIVGAAVLTAGVLGKQVLVAAGGALVCFVAVVLLCRYIIPPAVAAFGKGLGRVSGPLGELAAGNAGRNPRRTTATATALLIGVCVTATMIVGIATVKASAPGALDEQFPIDVSVAGDPGSALPATLGERIGEVDRVTAVAALSSGEVSTAAGKELTVTGVDPAEAAMALRVSITLPKPGQIAVSPKQLDELGVRAGEPIDVRGAGTTRSLTVVEGTEGPPPLMVRGDLAAVTANPAVDSLWVRFADGLTDDEIATVQKEVTSLATDSVPTAEIGGAVSMRAALNSVLDTMLMIVVGLLSVAILIAVIGVGNTMALSVIERRRESGLLRSIGVTRAGLRTLLIYEAVLVSVVASVLGVVLGLAFGLAGTASVFGVDDLVLPSLPWLALAATVLVGGIAGVIAALLPARSAAKVPPVEAMAA